MKTICYVICCLALATQCLGQGRASQLHEQFKNARSKQNRELALYELQSLSARRDVTEREAVVIRKIAIELATSEDQTVRKVTCNILANIGDKSCAAAVNALLVDSIPGVAEMAVRASLMAHDEKTIDALGKFIAEHGTPSIYVGGNPAQALAAIGSKQARAKLEEIHNSTKDSNVKEQTGRALDAMNAKQRNQKRQ